MSNQIPESFSEEYASNVEMLLQQQPSRFREAVRVGNYTGRAAEVVQQVGMIDLVEKTTRHGDTPIVDTPHDVRWVHPKDKEAGQLIDKQDELKTLADFESPYVQTGAAAANRSMDDAIIQAALSNVTITGVDQDQIVSWDTFVTANPAHRIASGGTGMTVGKLRAAAKALRAAEVDMEMDPLYMALSAEQVEDLQAETELISIDFNNSRILVDGKLQPYMGFNFIHSERLGVSGNDRRCFAWARSGLALGLWNDVMGRVSELPGKSYATQVYTCLTRGATRVEEKKVVEVLCDES